MADKATTKNEKSKTFSQEVRFYGTGRRKCAVARVWLTNGSGKVTVNKVAAKDFVKRDSLEESIMGPLKATSTSNGYDVIAFVKGGGIAGQADAIRHGIARALLLVNPEFRKILKTAGYLTRDPREKEAKKYGRKKARKGYQYRKR